MCLNTRRRAINPYKLKPSKTLSYPNIPLEISLELSLFISDKILPIQVIPPNYPFQVKYLRQANRRKSDIYKTRVKSHGIYDLLIELSSINNLSAIITHLNR